MWEQRGSSWEAGRAWAGDAGEERKVRGKEREKREREEKRKRKRKEKRGRKRKGGEKEKKKEKIPYMTSLENWVPNMTLGKFLFPI